MKISCLYFSLANRLVGGLASENVRWAESVEAFKESAKTLPGDVLMTTAFVSYVGCFIKSYRVDLMEKQWLPFLSQLKVRGSFIISHQSMATESK